MSRDVAQSVLDLLDDEVIYPFFAIELLFDAGTFTAIDGDDYNRVLRLWTGTGTLIYNNESWFGAGSLISFDAIEETSEIAAKGATVTLSGVPSDVLSLALGQEYQGRQAKIYFGTFTRGALLQETSNYILLEGGGRIFLGDRGTEITEVFVGYMDQMNIEEAPDSSTIQLTLENKLVDLERPRIGRYTSEYQKSIYSSDKGFDFVESLQDLQLNWGRSNA